MAPHRVRPREKPSLACETNPALSTMSSGMACYGRRVAFEAGDLGQ
jgi:hypothetical protein